MSKRAMDLSYLNLLDSQLASCRTLLYLCRGAAKYTNVPADAIDVIVGILDRITTDFYEAVRAAELVPEPMERGRDAYEPMESISAWRRVLYNGK